MMSAPTGLEMWTRLHDLAERVPDVPPHQRAHLSILIDRLADLIDGDDEPDPPPTFAF